MGLLSRLRRRLVSSTPNRAERRRLAAIARYKGGAKEAAKAPDHGHAGWRRRNWRVGMSRAGRGAEVRVMEGR